MAEEISLASREKEGERRMEGGNEERKEGERKEGRKEGRRRKGWRRKAGRKKGEGAGI